MKTEIDSELIKQVKLGDEKAFTQLYELTYKHVYFLALKICKNDDDAKEVTQLTFLQVQRSISNLRDENTFLGWLRRITVSKCYNLFHHNRDSVYDPQESKLFIIEQEKRRYMLPSSQSRFQSDKDVIMHLIDELPEKYSSVLVLMYFEELSILEISDLLKIPEGTVKSRLSTARANLHAKVLQYERENDTCLNFQALDGVLLTTIYAASYTALNVSIPLVGSAITALPFLSKLKHFLITSSTKIAIASVVTGVTTIGAYGAYQVYQSYKDDEPLTYSTPDKNSLKYNEDEVVFEPIRLNDVTYNKSREAYYELLYWAHCEVELDLKNPTEIQLYKPLYSALKHANSTYYQALETRGWTSKFEELSK